MATFQVGGKFGKVIVLIDDVDDDLASAAWRQACAKGGRTVYLQRREGRTGTRLLHREILERVLGRRLLKGEYVDHMNCDGLDNRRCNLRIATPRQSVCNRRSARGSTSQYLGVYFDTSRGKWRAKIKAATGRYEHLGRFDLEEEAAEAYDAAASREHGDFARLNLPRACP